MTSVAHSGSAAPWQGPPPNTTEPSEARQRSTSFSLTDRYTVEDGTVYLSGIQALVRMVRDRAKLDRRQLVNTASLICGYEGSPLAGYDLEVGRRRALLEPYGIVHRPGLNEELAATSVMGTQLAGRVATLRESDGRRLDGIVGYWYGKSPGLDRASDALRHANLAGTSPTGGAVALVGDDPGAKSSSVPCVSEMTLADLYIPTLVPADSQDILDLGVHAAAMSRISGVWTAMKISTHVADASSTAVVHPNRILPIPGDLGQSPHVPSGKLLGANLMELEQNQLTIRLPRALEYARINRLNRITVSTRQDRLGIVAAGKTYLDVREALQLMGLDDAELNRRGIRLLKLGLVYPMERATLHRFVDGLDEVIVVEEKRDFIETMIREILYGSTRRPRVVGKANEDGSNLFSRFGELDIDAVTLGLAERLAKRHQVAAAQAWLDGPGRRPSRIELPLVARTPYFCSGCPHNASTKVDDGTIVGAGIGCHTMVMFLDPSQAGEVSGLTQMGGEGAQWLGMAPFVEETHFLQNIGDGTFFHSGSLALRAAVASGENITYKLLYNGTVAMTGGQDPVGVMTLPEVVRLLLAEGVAQVVVTTDDVRRTRAACGRNLPKGVAIRDRTAIVEVQRDLATVPGVTVLVHDQPCAAENRRKRKRGQIPTPATRIVINERICEGCGDCGRKSNCLSVHPVETEFGRKTRIDQSSCNLDTSCVQGECPAFVTVIPGVSDTRRAPALAADAVPEPTLPTVDPIHGYGTRITGIGGTGIVTASAILATAAVIDGLSARTLDMTGLAQKGGAVVSDVKITLAPSEQAAKIATHAADLYLCCDGLVGADPKQLKVADAARTTAVISDARVPTGAMVVDSSVVHPDGHVIRSTISRSAARTVHLNPTGLVTGLFGDTQVSNIFMLGAAYQAGAVPVRAAAIENALELNGTSVDVNVQAFRRGRQAVASPEALSQTLAELHPVRPEPVASAGSDEMLADLAGGSEELRALVARRVDELVAYQDAAYARRYLRRVESFRHSEQAQGSETLTLAVALNLHKLMAYKDEYEVARLATDPDFEARITDEFGKGARFANQLEPPALRGFGFEAKFGVGGWGRPGLRALAKFKSLRGTPFDPFGRLASRKLERALLAEYESVLDRLLMTAPLVSDPVWIAWAAEIASLPDLVRGYESVKETSVVEYRRRLQELVAALPAA